MAYEERRTTVVRNPVDPAPPTLRAAGDEHVVEERNVAAVRPTGATLASRIVILVFGLIQLLIGLRILLLALDAREGNALVAGILDASQVLVAPFEGIFQTNALKSGGSVLDVAAIAALVGWTILELVILAILRIPRASDRV